MKNLLLVVILVFGIKVSQAQNIPSSEGTELCSNCPPNTEWQVKIGTPDVSDKNTAAKTGTLGEGQRGIVHRFPYLPTVINSGLPLEILEIKGVEEAVKTTMTGLFPGKEYEVTIYSLSATSSYAGKYIDKFDFSVGALPRVSVNDVSREVWGTNKLRFTANAASMDLTFYPGSNSDANTPADFECENISVTLDAINQLPLAENKTASTTAEPVTMIIRVTDTTSDFPV